MYSFLCSGFNRKLILSANFSRVSKSSTWMKLEAGASFSYSAFEKWWSTGIDFWNVQKCPERSKSDQKLPKMSKIDRKWPNWGSRTWISERTVVSPRRTWYYWDNTSHKARTEELFCDVVSASWIFEAQEKLVFSDGFREVHVASGVKRGFF